MQDNNLILLSIIIIIINKLNNLYRGDILAIYDNCQ